jgi:hypothetical protein
LRASEYRPEIDGLRAIAVVCVVLFHLNLVSGRFVGVDVFLVISGYLITGLLERDIKEGSFSFYGFYARRARRMAIGLLSGFTRGGTWQIKQVEQADLSTASSPRKAYVLEAAQSIETAPRWRDAAVIMTDRQKCIRNMDL